MLERLSWRGRRARLAMRRIDMEQAAEREAAHQRILHLARLMGGQREATAPLAGHSLVGAGGRWVSGS
jgi:hypothetical protein